MSLDVVLASWRSPPLVLQLEIGDVDIDLKDLTLIRKHVRLCVLWAHASCTGSRECAAMHAH